MEAFWTAREDVEERIDAEFYKPEFVTAFERIRDCGVSTSLKNVWDSFNRIYIGIAGYDSVADSSGHTPYLRPTDIGENGEINYCQLPWCESHWLDDHSLKGCAKPGDLILEVKGNTRKAAVINDRIPKNCLVSGSAYRIRLKTRKDTHFFQAFFLSKTGQALKRRLVSNTTISYIDPESFRDQLVVDPIEEIQHAIGNKVRKAERLRELAEAADMTQISLIGKFIGCPDESQSKKTAFLVDVSRLSNYRINPTEYHPALLLNEEFLLSNFQSRRLDQIIDEQRGLSGGSTPDGAIYPKEGIYFLRVQNVLRNKIDHSDAVFIDSATDDVLCRSRLQAGDVVVSITGYPGTAAVATSRDTPSNINQHIIRFKPRDGIDPEFIAAFINSPWGKLQVARRSIGGTRDALDFPSVASLIIPMIDPHHMRLIGDQCRIYRSALDESEDLMKEAVADIEAVIDGNINREKIIAEGLALDAWLASHPRPEML